jgi:hypothetical protein
MTAPITLVDAEVLLGEPAPAGPGIPAGAPELPVDARNVPAEAHRVLAGADKVPAGADKVPAGAEAPARRTVVIKGRGAERNLPWEAPRRPSRLPHHRSGFKPDRVAMWAVFLGFLLVLVAAMSGHG